jgi:hypothetical protein
MVFWLKIPSSSSSQVLLRPSIEMENYFVHQGLMADWGALNRNCEHLPMTSWVEGELMTSLMGAEPEPVNDTEEASRMELT